ncbi:MAG: hypothetical protein ACLFQZ_13455, partial [Spirochaetaceae bacterium]
RFEQVDKRFEQVDKRFEQVDKRFEDMNGRLAEMNGRIESLVVGMRRFMIWSFGFSVTLAGVVIAAVALL